MKFLILPLLMLMIFALGFSPPEEASPENEALSETVDAVSTFVVPDIVTDYAETTAETIAETIAETATRSEKANTGPGDELIQTLLLKNALGPVGYTNDFMLARGGDSGDRRDDNVYTLMRC